jgi:hypothetical protein
MHNRLLRVGCVLILYAAVYCTLRATRVLVHRNYLYWDEDAPQYTTGGGYIEVDDVGHGSVFNENGLPVNSRADRFCRFTFYPLVKAEEWYWRANASGLD